MSAIAPRSAVPFQAAIRRHALGVLLAAYVVLLLAALATANVWLDAAAALLLISLLLSPGLRRRSAAAWLLWLATCAGFAALASHGHGRLALDLLPACVNAALCLVFARTLAPGGEPLIARVIGVVEGPERLALPRVAGYARGLTLVWAAAFGAQALWLATIVVFAAPEGLLAVLGVAAPLQWHGLQWQGLQLHGIGWRWYLHVGSYACTLLLLLLEYGFRRWYLDHIPHVPLPLFAGRLARRWPALVRSLVDEAGTRRR